MLSPKTVFNLKYYLVSFAIAGALAAGSLLIPKTANAATLRFNPTSQTILVGDNLSATVVLDTQGDAIDRVLADISYPANILTLVSIDQSQSELGIWYPHTNNAGRVVLDGGVSGAGLNMSDAVIATINFTTASEGVTSLTFNTNSAVYRESDSTNVLSEAYSVSYSVVGPTATPIPTFGPSSTPTPIAPTLPPTTATPTGTLTITPSTDLPKSGTFSSTLALASFAGILSLTGFLLLRKA